MQSNSSILLQLLSNLAGNVVNNLGLAVCWKIELVNELLLSPMGRRDWPFRFYSRERLFSVAARRDFVGPDLAAFP